MELVTYLGTEISQQNFPTVNGRRRRDNAVGIATGYGLDDRGIAVRVPISNVFSSPQRRDRLRGPPSYSVDTGGKAAGA
jgi:hypothetical protein